MGGGRVLVGCAGWSLPRDVQPEFGAGASHLARYATRLAATEINSSFHRPHPPWVWRRWAEAVPEGFRFSVKLPRTITHERRLLGCEAGLDAFLAQATLLGPKLACLLVQLPPSLAFDAGVAGLFTDALRARFDGDIALEPRHASWFEPAADTLLAARRIARVLADPVRHDAGRQPGGWPGLVYVRLHGSPRMYYSAYDATLLAALAARIALASAAGTGVWCIFDNTAAGAATANALALMHHLAQEDPP